MSPTPPGTPDTTPSSAPAGSADAPYEPPETWIPADQRTYGFDRRTIVPGVVVLVFAVIISFLPGVVDGHVDYDDAVRSSDVIELAKGVAFTPAVGWDITDGVRRGDPLAGGGYPPSAGLTRAGVTFTMQAADFRGTPGELLDRIQATRTAYGIESPVTETQPVAVTTSDGHRGVTVSYEGPRIDGVIAAFTGDGVGVQVAVVSPTTHDKQATIDVAQMIESITIEGANR